MITRRFGVLGWGSLIWDKEKNREKGFKIEGDWFENGPLLPIEFARISDNSRLTLVLYPAAKKVQVLWAYIKVSNLNEAINMLRYREGPVNKSIDFECIGFYDKVCENFRCRCIPDIIDDIKQWTNERNLDGVVWTDLPSNFHEKKETEFNETNLLNYIKSNHSKQLEEYIRKAPFQIQTSLRTIIEKELGWTPI